MVSEVGAASFLIGALVGGMLVMVLVRSRMTQPRRELLADSFSRLAVLLEWLLVMVPVKSRMTQPRGWRHCLMVGWWWRLPSVRAGG